MSHTILLTIFSILILIGIPLTFVPMFPAILYMVIVAIIFGISDGFVNLAVWEMIILGLAFPISFLIDYSAGIIGAKYGGASKTAIIWGIIGLALGFIIPIPFGSLAGLFIGVFSAEIAGNYNYIKAFKAGAGSVAGTLAGMFINCCLAVIFLVLFIIFAI